MSDPTLDDTGTVAINSSMIGGLTRRVRTEIDSVQRQIESLQVELLRLREQERLLAELGATTVD